MTNKTNVKELNAVEFAKERRKAAYTSKSNWMEFLESHKGYEFYDKYTKQSVPMWLIHNSFTDGEIYQIKCNRNMKFGYRIKQVINID